MWMPRVSFAPHLCQVIFNLCMIVRLFLFLCSWKRLIILSIRLYLLASKMRTGCTLTRHSILFMVSFGNWFLRNLWSNLNLATWEVRFRLGVLDLTVIITLPWSFTFSDWVSLCNSFSTWSIFLLYLFNLFCHLLLLVFWYFWPIHLLDVLPIIVNFLISPFLGLYSNT